MDARLRATSFAALNVASGTIIVFVNKAVFTTYRYHFTYFVTLLHTWTTVFGMVLFCYFGLFQRKKVPFLQLVPLAAAFVSYIVLGNLNLQVNTVSFYQIAKIAVAPVVLAVEVAFFGKTVSPAITASVILVCLGVGLSTLTDFQLGMTLLGFAIGVGHVLATSFYLVWVGTKQKELGLTSMQLLDQYSPVAGVLLLAIVPVCENVGWQTRGADTLLGYTYTTPASTAILLSCVLGLLVSLSTFLFIGATSSLTYNIVGHTKTLIVLSGGFLVFGEPMPMTKLAGITMVMVGIIWYSLLSMQPAPAAAPVPETVPLIPKDKAQPEVQKIPA